MENSKIEWCDHTFNPWRICTPCSPGCANCYAAALAKRFGWGEYRKGIPRQRTSAANWKLPLKWNAAAAMENGKWKMEKRRPRVFCASLADWLDDEVPIEWLADLLKLIHETPNLDWLLLTKRPENFLPRLIEASLHLCGYRDGQIFDIPIARTDDDGLNFAMEWSKKPPTNVWVGASVEDQKRDERIPALLQIPAKVRFLSVEPMLEAVRFDGKWKMENGKAGINWAIFGGESGPGARPCNVEWIREGIKQCRAAGVAPFVKQLGSLAITENANNFDWPDDAKLKGIPGGAFAEACFFTKDKKGGDMDEWPEELRVREFPKSEICN